MIGKDVGINSPLFAVSLIFSLVVMYDAAGVRRAAGKQAKLLNKIVETPGLTGVQMHEKLVEVLGHSPKEVIVGALIGLIVGLVF
jgi:acid phosphatase family membrane protein YuiD